MGTEQIKFFTVPLADSPAVKTYFPVAINCAVTLTAKPVGFLKRDIFSRHEMQIVSFIGAMAVETPHPIGMLQGNVCVHAYQNPWPGIGDSNILSKK